MCVYGHLLRKGRAVSQHSFSGRAARKYRDRVLSEYGTTCHLCGLPGATTVDHLIPRSHGGENSIENGRPAHSRCNSARGNMPLSQWFLQQKKKRAQGGATHTPTDHHVSEPSRNW
ncbi:HNH endonuclease signature motif containing protein [Rhodococcus sp. IEGM 1318]|uniref:HNH endonuclease n=1 Tax=Rhodococcus sp. IEGM 1318 TaxID=3082226 RepID=UPI002955DFBA|nr:HNH endonuclease signature motif containing protein [Rhodococcus sp. IEGM 1318]MDV8003847.1 HNH endonuclease signature motif containing protein [Rhodococcus sp. IEGM 1318]